MAKLTDISIDDAKQDFIKRLSRIIQSANLNFLIGSGCSCPAIPVLGDIESKIKEDREKGKNDEAEHLLHNFLVPFLENTNLLIKNDISVIQATVNNYHSFIEIISSLLFNRKSNIISSQATIFSTNYDLLIEYVMKDFNDTIILCDGFKRTADINNEYFFSSAEYFNTTHNTGTLYRYKVEIPSINLIKLHGSLNWQKKNGRIIQDLSYIENAIRIKDSRNFDDIKQFNSLFSVCL